MKRTNFFAYILSPLMAGFSFALGIKYNPSALKETVLILLAMSISAVIIEKYGNQWIHYRLQQKRREDKAKMIADYANIIDKAKPKKRKIESLKRKKR